MTGTGKWAQRGVPHKGWRCVDIEDLGEPSAICEMCEVMEIRYVHIMEHDDYPDELAVGCICAGNMEQDLVGARKRETDFKRLQNRRKRWLSRHWQTSRAGNDYLNTDGFNIVVYPRGTAWGARVEDREDGDRRMFTRSYRTQDEAKLAALDAMLGMKQSSP